MRGLKITEAEFQGKRPTFEDTHFIGSLRYWNQMSSARKEKAAAEFLRSLQSRRVQELMGDYSGTTAVGFVLSQDRVYPMNIGDSVLFSLVIDKDHKLVKLKRVHRLHIPTDIDEKTRILATPGAEIVDGRVGGVYNLTRHIGSLETKMPGEPISYTIPGLSFEPDQLNSFPLPKLKQDQRHFLIVACDGFTEPDDYSELNENQSERAYPLVEQWLNETVDAKALAEKAIEAGSGDNVTVVVVETTKMIRDDIQSKMKNAKALMVVLFDGHNGEKSAEWCRDHALEVMDDVCTRGLSRKLPSARRSTASRYQKIPRDALKKV